MIDTKEAELADDFLCYCGRVLEVQPVIACSGCRKAPADCRCPEFEEAA